RPGRTTAWTNHSALRHRCRTRMGIPSSSLEPLMTASTEATASASPAANRIALVSGASRGIGAAIARSLAAAGHPVALGHRTGADEAALIAKGIIADGGRALPVALDVTDADSVD